MKRRDFLAASAMFIASPVVAQGASPVDLIVEQLKGQGFTSIQVTRTWLGRMRIVARNETYRREIILNPHTGEILRDLWEVLGSGEQGDGLFDSRRSSGGRNDDEDDEDDDEEDDEEDDDEEDDDEEDDE